MCASSGHVPQPTRTHTPLAAVVQKGKMIAIVPPADRPRLVLTRSPLARKWQFAGRERRSPKQSRLLKPYRRNRQFGDKCLAGEFLRGTERPAASKGDSRWCPRQDSNLRTHLRRTVERVVMATMARIARDQRPIDPRIPSDRHGFIPRTIPRDTFPVVNEITPRPPPEPPRPPPQE